MIIQFYGIKKDEVNHVMTKLVKGLPEDLAPFEIVILPQIYRYNKEGIPVANINLTQSLNKLIIVPLPKFTGNTSSFVLSEAIQKEFQVSIRFCHDNTFYY